VIAAALEEQLSAIVFELKKARRRAKPGRVHRLRVASRRLAAGLELAELLGLHVRGRSRRFLRELLGTLSPLRDAQVQAQTLTERAGTPAEVLTFLRQKSSKARRRATRALRRMGSRKLEQDVTDLVGNLLALPESLANVVEGALVGGLAERHLAIESERKEIDDRSAHSLHLVRLTLKSYRYRLEILAPVLPARAGAVLETTKRLQEQLGKAHDQHVLAETARHYARSAFRDWSDELARTAAEAQRASAVELAQASYEFPFD
jgi:CHAD domain-containing protein